MVLDSLITAKPLNTTSSVLCVIVTFTSPCFLLAGRRVARGDGVSERAITGDHVLEVQVGFKACSMQPICRLDLKSTMWRQYAIAYMAVLTSLPRFLFSSRAVLLLWVCRHSNRGSKPLLLPALRGPPMLQAHSDPEKSRGAKRSVLRLLCFITYVVVIHPSCAPYPPLMSLCALKDSAGAVRVRSDSDAGDSSRGNVRIAFRGPGR